MKFKIYKISLCLAIFAAFGCDDALDQEPLNSLIADTAFQNIDDLQSGLNSVYANYNANLTIQVNSIFTDNTKIGVDNGGQEVQLHSLVLDPTSGVSLGIWSSRYAMINNATRVIEAANNIDIVDTERANSILGQAYALRAFAHFELYSYFTPDLLNDDGISVPAVDFIVTTENLPRNTVGEVFNLVESDIATSRSLLSAENMDVRFISRDFLTALEARIALFRGNYTEAISKATNLINDYELANPEQYSDMFLDADNTEVIWKAARVDGDARPGFIWHFSGGGPFIEMSNSLYDELEEGDVRRSVNFNVEDSAPEDNLHLINKYPGNALEFLNDVKVFRVSEMYLIRAEAYARTNNFALAQEDVDDIRDARFGSDVDTPSFGSQQAALDFILSERRIELAYESHRYLDLKRFETGLNRESVDCAQLNNACSLPASDRRFTFPIPIAEMNANPLMTQNPGY